MKFSKTQTILINALLSLVVAVLGAYLVSNQQFTASVLACGIIISSIIGFNIYRSLRSRQPGEVHFADNFENFEGCTAYRDGNVFHSDDQVHSGKFSLKKVGF